jgi:hypothetical protein
MVIDEEQGLAPLEVHYSASMPVDTVGKPYWVAVGRVELTRETYDRSRIQGDAWRLWTEPRRFFIPAYTCSLDDMISLGPELLLEPPALDPGSPVRFEPVTLSVKDLVPMADFIVLGIEADRSDKLKEVQISVELSNPELWILPE